MDNRWMPKIPLSKIGGIFFISVIIFMKDLEVKGITVRLTKYKLIILDKDDDVKDSDAENIAQYLYDEGFIKKDNFPVEIINPND